ncbi:MAG TPA: helix-turn-helix domain-containing protein [Bacteroidales bacterium]|nr:helix-turn-helix domain-containing protein [Bacteroidales bacterium]HRX97575.1 helix-turn-helix domain-containing protein [Bacteroidales bacterium]
MPVINIIILVGSIQGIFLSFLIFFKKHIVFHRLFGVILFSISLALLIAYLQLVLDYQTYSFLIKLNVGLPLIFVPGLLIYLRKLSGTHTVNDVFTYLLFLPLALIIIYNLPFYFGNVSNKLEYFIRNEIEGKPHLIERFEEIFIEFFVTLFSFIAIIESRKYKKRVELVFSNQSKAKSRWISFLAYSMFILTSFALILSVLALFIEQTPLELNFVTAIGSTIVIYYIAYYLLTHQQAFTEISSELSNLSSTEPGNTLKKDSEAKLHKEFEKKIIDQLQKEKIYTNPNITLSALADKIGLPPYLTSKIINTNLNFNFYTLVNYYRLEQVKQELLVNPEKSIIEIAWDAGFNSKTTFYEAFKKDTGLSPSEFINRNKLLEN